MLYVIYKTFYNNFGDLEKIELVEADVNESSAISFTKLYNLQTPKDLKEKVKYEYITTRIVE